MNLVVLGATGSIGASTLDVAAGHPDRYRVFALTAHASADALRELCRVHRPAYAVLAGVPPDRNLERRFLEEAQTRLLFGAEALEQIVGDAQCDAVMAGIVGAAGLASTLAAARAGKRVLLANKEALVMAGPLVMRAARDSGAALLPVDSEHNAVFQCLSDVKAVRRILLTASGGPFRALPLDKLDGVTPDQACAHPNWVMGRKISVDSATMMNKGLEVIEAHWLFGAPAERIEVLIHPQSIVHSMVAYHDGSVLAQLGNPDMRTPIAYGLAYPERIDAGVTPLDLTRAGGLNFEKPDLQRFPCLGLAFDALRAGGVAPAVLNAANEVAVEAFLGGKVRFTDIAGIVRQVLEAAPQGPADTLEAVLDADRLAREAARSTVAPLAANR